MGGGDQQTSSGGGGAPAGYPDISPPPPGFYSGFFLARPGSFAWILWGEERGERLGGGTVILGRGMQRFWGGHSNREGAK